MPERPAPPEPPVPPALPDAGAAAALVAPVEGSPDGQPDAVSPQERPRVAPPPRRQPPSRRLRPGDLICGDCGEGNDQIRKFCSRCGASLLQAEQVKTPWWRKLLPRRGVKRRKSGARPKSGGRGRTPVSKFLRTFIRGLRRVLVVVIFLGGVAYGVFPAFRAEVNDRAVGVKETAETKIFGEYLPVNPVDIAATAELADNPGQLAVDGFFDTAWKAPVDGEDPALVLDFGRKVDLARAILRNGTSDGFQDSHRVERLHLVFSNGKTTDLILKDAPDPQQLDIKNGKGVTGVEIHIIRTFNSVDGTDVAFSEIELFEKK